MGAISLIWGCVALLWMALAFLPLLGWGNWFVIPFAVVGAVLAGIALLFTAPGARGRAKAGLVINLVVMVVATLRLMLGGGLI